MRWKSKRFSKAIWRIRNMYWEVFIMTSNKKGQKDLPVELDWQKAELRVQINSDGTSGLRYHQLLELKALHNLSTVTLHRSSEVDRLGTLISKVITVPMGDFMRVWPANEKEPTEESRGSRSGKGDRSGYATNKEKFPPSVSLCEIHITRNGKQGRKLWVIRYCVEVSDRLGSPDCKEYFQSFSLPSSREAWWV